MAENTGTPTLRERKREKTRAAIVDAAMELFETRGYHGTTLADIAAAAEIGTRTFFSYFASKDDLLFPEQTPGSSPRSTRSHHVARTTVPATSCYARSAR